MGPTGRNRHADVKDMSYVRLTCAAGTFGTSGES